MNSAHKLPINPEQATPLVNLFAYIRDLFNTSQPVLRFDQDPRNPQSRNLQWWALDDLFSLQSADHDDIFKLQFENPDQPILRIKRTDPVVAPEVPEALKGWVKIDRKPGQEASLQFLPKKKTRFHENPKRVEAFRLFQQEVDGKEIEIIKDISIPSVLDGWLDLKEEDGILRVAALNSAEEKFQADELRMELAKSYQRKLKSHFNQFSKTEQLNRVYEALHTLYYELKAEAERRFSLSFGLVVAGEGKHRYENFLFHLPLRIELERQEIRIESDFLNGGLSCETSFLELLPQWFPGEPEALIEHRRHEVLRHVDQFQRKNHDFQLEEDHIRQYYHDAALKILSVFPVVEDRFFTEEGKLNLELAEEQIKGNGLVRVSFSPVFQTRMMENGIHVSQDAAAIMDHIQELAANGKNELVPEYFKRLFSLNQAENPIRIAWRNKQAAFRTDQTVVVRAEAEPERFLFPLPYNDEQLTIAKRLLSQEAVIVKGPPGTGKSHTIANLCSHYVAQGKSILIVSKNAKALDVIRGKLPKEIRSLAISMVKPEAQSQEMKFAIDNIKDELGRPRNEEDIHHLETKLTEKEQRFREVRKLIIQTISENNQEILILNPISGENENRTAADWAVLLQQIPTPAFTIQDTIGEESSAEKVAGEMYAMWQIFLQTDHQLISYQYINPRELPSPELIKHLNEQLSAWETNPISSEFTKISPGQLASPLPEQWKSLQEFKSQWETFAKWVQHPSSRPEVLIQIFQRHQKVIELSEKEHQNLLAFEFDLSPLEFNPTHQLIPAVEQLLEKFDTKGNLPFLKRRTLNKKEKALLSCQVNRMPADHPKALQTLLRYLQQQKRIEQLHILLNNYFRGIGEDISQDQVLVRTAAIRDFVECQSRLHAFNQLLRSRGLTEVVFPPSENQLHWLGKLDDYLKYIGYEKQYDSLEIKLKEEHYPLLRDLLQAWKNKDSQAYSEVFHQYQEIYQLAENDQSQYTLVLNWAKAYPDTLNQWKENHWPETITQEDILNILFSQQIRNQLLDILENRGQLDEYFQELRQLKSEMEELTIQLVSMKSWYQKQQSISPEQKSALSAWRNDLINIGKGHGKNTGRNMNSAIANMQKAREVVPIWIMQQDTAIRFFPDPTPGQFDLLTVDEASQCDISMLNLIFRAHKTIIVGDENQTSVSTNAALFPIERTNQILDRFLHQHPFRQQFHINNRTASIYTLSGVIYPNIISLREHFRCRPEIIGFSNRNVYDSQIIPLKTATDQHFGNAVEAFYIADDPKDKKKKRIVEQVIELIEGVVDDFQRGMIPKIPSVGILCLESSNEAHRDQIIRGIARSQTIKGYEDELQLLVGTSREFQGDERDVMILTTTASHGVNKNGQIRPPRAVMGEEMSRIYNVAASRAREKSILLHSIHPEAVAAMNPNCLRYRLLSWYQQTGQSGAERNFNPVHALARKGKIATELYQWLKEQEQEAEIIPDYQIGEYQLDFAWMKEGQKIAIVLDGVEQFSQEEIEANLSQQLILERAGWKFVRIQALGWMMDQEREKAKLA